MLEQKVALSSWCAPCARLLIKVLMKTVGAIGTGKHTGRNMNITKLLLQTFRGNRFNVGGCTYHLKQLSIDLLDKVHGASNLLLKALQTDLKVPVYLAGCRVLGLLNKLITAPLWHATFLTCAKRTQPSTSF